MKLKIDTSHSKNTFIELIDKKGKIVKKVNKHQSLGSQILLPEISKILRNCKINIKQVKEIEVNPGPGSFTGLRVGIAVANTLGFILNIPVNGKKGKIVKPIYTKTKFDK